MKIFYDELLSVTNEDLDQNNTFYIPDGIKTIHSNAFLKASKLKKLHIPDSVDLIMTGSFLGCNNLKEINIPNNCPSFNIDHLNNISVINIDSKIKDVTLLTNLLINKATTTKINFKYDCLIFSFDKNKKYAVKKVENNIFTLTTDNFEDCVLITNNGIKKCNKGDLLPYIKDNDFDRFKRTHSHIFLENINIFYQWIDIINNLKGNSFNYFPNEIVMLSIPSNKKAVKEYILKNKTWQKIEKKLSNYSKKEIIGYMKFS
ncbi:MAG: leucine-rich repeat protein, partial [Bacilli bacterium]|nr:leucine-rich repeat protein [Bacilli bacterium]